MTVTQRKKPNNAEDFQIVNEPGVQIECDGCACDLTHSVRIRCAAPECERGDGVDICPSCFCNGKEFRKHKKDHPYRVIELHSYPIFSEDWGADEELLLLEGISLQGLGNWQAIAEHVGTRTKEEVEQHYNSVYVDSPNWPLPVSPYRSCLLSRLDREFDVDPAEFQERKRRRISAMPTTIPAPAKPVTSAPGVHEVATFLPGRLEFEHELDNEAEDLVKDLEFAVCLEYGGDEIPEDEHDPDVCARIKLGNEKRDVKKNGSQPPKSEDGQAEQAADEEGEAEEQTQPPPFETRESLAFKLTLLEMYSQRVQRRREAKALMFDRGLLDYKKMQANDKKRPREEKEIIQRLRPFAKLQTAQDFEEFVTDMLYEHTLRRRIQELQLYRRLGLRTAADIDQYELDAAKRGYFPPDRVQQLRAASGRPSAGPEGRHGSVQSLDRRSRSREPTPSQQASGSQTSVAAAPLNLANSPSLHLLTPAEQALCSSLRILPKPYLVIKETLVREYARRGGKLRRREARDLVKIDVNKTSRVWDFLVQAGYLRIGQDASTSQDNRYGYLADLPRHTLTLFAAQLPRVIVTRKD
ncbi:SWIRM-domain-containing protein [Gloeophyllum trabeum ATCC 11539]|uniref:Transcriptional adapter 2 n=1 Tax=Gloeophyllum trabeum (strain ATCC 11539 / FP-39264 / Madison 617) TaxID=670483 RepID=S7QCM2_GLOTA|nr:SWIRM-domain-containing protein [Gloeophyllum trabeum ATCC 11539]EPQ57143.1 SWIRM-domain-containing protein [Gloeophyllum trabeum ATCC 11539]